MYLNIHNITSITVTPTETNTTEAKHTYSVRKIIINTTKGTVEITLFSDGAELLKLKDPS